MISHTGTDNSTADDNHVRRLHIHDSTVELATGDAGAGCKGGADFGADCIRGV
jgi:hypothetical protein